MKKVLISVFAIIGCVLVAIAILLLLLPRIINTETVKQELIDAVKAQSGQTLTIEGDLSLSIFPRISLNSGPFALSQPAALNTETPLAHADAMGIDLQLLPLLRKQLIVDKFYIDGAKLHYVVSADGKTSLDGFDAANSKRDANQKEESTTSNASPAKDSRTSALILLGGIELSNASLTVDNQLDKKQHTVSNLQLQTGRLSLEEATPIAISAAVTLNKQDTFFIDINSRFITQLSEQIINIVDTSIALKAKNIDHELIVTSDKVTLNIAKKEADIPFTFSLPTANASMTGQILFKNWDKQWMFKGQAETNRFTPTIFLSILGSDYQYSDPKALQRLSLSSQFSGSANGLSLHSLAIQLDESTITGDIAIINFEQPRYRFDLQVDRLNVDRYLPPSETNKDTNADKQNKDSPLAIALPIAALNEIDANGALRAKQLTIGGLQIDTLKTVVESSRKNKTIKPSLTLYNGNAQGAITLTNENQAQVLAEMNFNQVNIGDLLKDTQISDQLSGIADVDLNLKFSSKNQKSNMLDKNTGLIKLAVKDGELKGFDLKGILDNTQKTIDQLRGKVNETEEKTSKPDDKTRFAALTASFVLNNNVLSNNDLAIKAPAFRVSGKGTVSLEAQTLDYLSNIAVVDTNTGQGGEEKSDLNSIVIPVRFYGDISAPRYRVDMRELVKQNTQKEVDKQKEKLKQKALEKLGLPTEKTEQSENKKVEDVLKEKLIKELFK